jgi:two-component system chemotaxis response regulator CheB
MNVAVAPPPEGAVQARLRVMIVDDAAVVRGLFSRWIAAEPDLEVVACLSNGAEAVREVQKVAPDVVLLDVEMPELDGIAALSRLLERRRDLVVIMASTVTRRNAEISLRALALGAADYIPKPSPREDVGAFRRALIEKVRQLGTRNRMRRLRTVLHAPVPRRPLALRPMPLVPPRALMIGASTGGPQALELLLLNAPIVHARVPILITQHMPPTFTALFAEQLARAVRAPVHEARHGEAVTPGTIYIAPGDRHMRVAGTPAKPTIALDDGAQLHFCRPAVDPLFTSGAAVWGSQLLALVLTGMGQDGLAGARAVVAAGGHVMAQDEATSVVWGMPGQVAQAGLCFAVLPLPEIGPRLNRLFVGERV